MTIEYKILAQTNIGSLQEVIYTVPVNGSAVVSKIFISNSSNINDTCRILIVPYADQNDIFSKHYVIDQPVLANSSYEVSEKFSLSSQDKIYALSTSSNVNINIFGIETTP